METSRSQVHINHTVYPVERWITVVARKFLLMPERACPRLQLLPRRVEAPKPSGLAHNVPLDGLQQVFACRVGRQIQLRVQSVEFEDVMVDRPAGAPGPK